MERSPPAGVTAGRLRRLRPFAFLALAGIALYVLLPSLLAVFGSWRSLSHLDWPFAVAVLGCEAASFVCLWQLDRIALRTRAWRPVIAAQLAGNAAGRIFPGGGATATVVSTSMLRQAGIDTGDAAAAFATSTLLQLATTFALPILALPAIVGGAPIDHSLATAAYLGAVVFVLLLAAGSLLLLTDRPLELVGHAAQWGLNRTVRRKRPMTNLAQEVIDARDFVRTTLGRQWWKALLAAAGNTGFDYLALPAPQGLMIRAPRGSSAERRPVRSIPGAASGVESVGTTQPVFPREAPPPTAPASSTTTSKPRSCSEKAEHSPTTPAPTTATRTTLESHSDFLKSIYDPSVEHAPGLPRNQSLQRAVTLLRAVAAHPEGATIATLAGEIDLPRPTTGRLLATLADSEFVERVADGDGWVLGREILLLGRAADPHRRLARLAQPHLERLAAEAGESAMLGVSERPGTLEVIAQADAGNLVGVGNWVGRRFGLHASAGGKLVYAGLDAAELEAALAETTLERYTARTLTTRAALQAELRRVRRLGYAETVDELEEGLSSIGVAVGPSLGSTLVSVGISGPTSRLTARRRRRLVPVIRACAARIRAQTTGTEGTRAR
jgi:hypothetical protein